MAIIIKINLIIYAHIAAEKYEKMINKTSLRIKLRLNFVKKRIEGNLFKGEKRKRQHLQILREKFFIFLKG